MKNENHNAKLFGDFSPVDQQQWVDKAIQDLKGADFDKRLVWKNENGIVLQPFYTQKNQEDTLDHTGTVADDFVNYRRIEINADSNLDKAVQRAMDEGVNGLIFSGDLEAALNDIIDLVNVSSMRISFAPDADPIGFGKKLLMELRQQSVNPDDIKGYLDTGILRALLTKDENHLELVKANLFLANEFRSFPNFKLLYLPAHNLTDTGANQVQEIACSLAMISELMEIAKSEDLSIDVIWNSLHLGSGLNTDYFIEIGKLRAMHSLTHQLGSLYGIENPEIQIGAKNSTWSTAVTDAHTNLLRETTQAMSAILGNADSIEIIPFDYAFAAESDFSNRISTNIVNILREESYFQKVKNPTDGSYYLEEISQQLAAKALDKFKEIEADGGLIHLLDAGKISIDIAEMRNKKMKFLSQRRQTLVGVNKFPNTLEELSQHQVAALSNGIENKNTLAPRRAGLELERLRLNTELFITKSGKRPLVHRLTFGHLAMRKARSAFAFDYLGIPGYDIEEELYFDQPEKALETDSLDKADIIVLCSSDDDYKEHIKSFSAAFKRKFPKKLLLLAGHPGDYESEWMKAGLDDCIHLKADICQVIDRLHKKLSSTTKAMEL